jgi:hypothetical protein
MPPDRPLAAGGGFAVRADDVGELFVELPLYRPTLFRRAKAGPADSCFLAIGYALGTAVEVIVHAEFATSLRRRNQSDFINCFNSLREWGFAKSRWYRYILWRNKG